MTFSTQELWVWLHGLILGGFLLLSFAVGIKLFWNFKHKNFEELGKKKNIRRLKLCLGAMALGAWLTAISGTYRVYPWYRENTPQSPRSRLLLDPTKAFWHRFGMEWKEHAAWLAPLLLTAAAYLAWRHGSELAEDKTVRSDVFWLFLVGSMTVGIAALLGACIHRASPFL